MNTTVALLLGFTIIALIAFDYRANDAENLVFLGRKGWELIEWMAFWR